MDMDLIAARLKTLEEQLLHTDVRRNPDLLRLLLSEDFEEIGSSGYVSSREEVVRWLITKATDDHWVLSDFRVRQLSDVLVLTIYHVKKLNDQGNSTQGSLRSSLWRRHANDWQMIFHQGTKVGDDKK